MLPRFLTVSFWTKRKTLFFLLCWIPVAWWLVPSSVGGFGTAFSVKGPSSGQVFEYEKTVYNMPLVRIPDEQPKLTVITIKQ